MSRLINTSYLFYVKYSTIARAPIPLSWWRSPASPNPIAQVYWDHKQSRHGHGDFRCDRRTTRRQDPAALPRGWARDWCWPWEEPQGQAAATVRRAQSRSCHRWGAVPSRLLGSEGSGRTGGAARWRSKGSSANLGFQCLGRHTLHII
jgi:hypothetical protein